MQSKFASSAATIWKCGMMLVALMFVVSAHAAVERLPSGSSDASSDSGTAEKCTAAYEKIIAVERCPAWRLPDFEVRFVGDSRPNERLPVHCRHFEAKGVGSEAASFKQCSTGVLGGSAYFDLDGKTFTAVFDLSQTCGQLANGRWALIERGHAFYPARVERDAEGEIRQHNSQRYRDCAARNGKP